MKNSLKTVAIVVICVSLCLGYYYYLTQRNVGKEGEMTEVEMIISKDLEKSYPKTAREVVKFYNRILKCYYSQEYTQEQLVQIAQQARLLMDEELRENNPQDVYLEAVKMDISAYKKEGKKIANMSVDRTNEVEYDTKKGKDYAYVDSSYFMKGKKDSKRVNQTYILRKDENSRWKILGFYQ